MSIIKEYDKYRSYKLSEHFRSNEFKCHGKGCCVKTLISDDLVNRLEILRLLVGEKLEKEAPLQINSGYRCKKHNRRVGGAFRSKHIQGLASDIRCPDGLSVSTFAELAITAGFTGIGYYNNRIHVDVRELRFKKNVFWGNCPDPKKGEL